MTRDEKITSAQSDNCASFFGHLCAAPIMRMRALKLLIKIIGHRRAGHRVAVGIALAISFTGTAIISDRPMAAICDLGPLTLPIKYFPSQLGQQNLSLGLDA